MGTASPAVASSGRSAITCPGSLFFLCVLHWKYVSARGVRCMNPPPLRAKTRLMCLHRASRAQDFGRKWASERALFLHSDQHEGSSDEGSDDEELD